MSCIFWRDNNDVRQIRSTKVLATREGIQRLIYLRKRVGVLNGDIVESVIVHIKPPATILLLDQDCWKAQRTVGRLKNVSVEKTLCACRRTSFSGIRRHIGCLMGVVPAARISYKKYP